MVRLVAHFAALCVALSLGLATLPSLGTSATSSTTVSASVPTATSFSASACPDAARQFGMVTPGIPATTAASCSVSFGSSNGVARLRMHQLDGRGTGMFRYASGARDATWGSAGSVFAAAGAGQDDASAMALAPDGSVYVGGYSDDAGTWRMRVMRISSSGSLDGSFGVGGVLTTSVVGPSQRYELGMAIQPDGKLLVAGPVPGSGGFDFGVMRYSASGVPDSGFGSGGLAQVAVTPSQDWASDVIVRPDGRIVVTGMTNGGASGVWDVAAVGLTATGSIDPRFGTAGQTISNSGGSVWDFAYSADLGRDGSIVIAGTSNVTSYDPTFLRLKSDGTVDTAFGAGGWVVAPMPAGLSYGQLFDVALLADGDIAGCGSIWDGSKYLAALLRYSPSGAVRSTFGASGWRIWSDAAGWISGCAELADGRIVAAGNRTGTQTAALFRVEADGAADTTLGTNGLAVETLGSGSSTLNDVDVSEDGALVAAGSAQAASRDMVVVRHAGLSIPDHASGIRDWDDGAGMFGVCLESSSGAGVDAPWSAVGAAACGPADSSGWRPVAAAVTDTGAQVATTSTSTTTAAVSFRFGFRSPATLAPGRYVAPVVFDVVAP